MEEYIKLAENRIKLASQNAVTLFDLDEEPESVEAVPKLQFLEQFPLKNAVL